MRIGPKLKELRVSQMMTQGELADRSDLTKGFISQLEHDQTSPSIATLNQILDVLGADLAEFFQQREAEQVVFGGAERVETEDPDEGVKFELLIPRAINGSALDPALVELAPGVQTEKDKMHEGEEFGFVMSGEVVLVLGKSEYRVRRGECFLFQSRQTHYLVNKGKRPAKLLWVTTPPTH
jgi:transcriptional regulator with XRE-family HTH domain